jgi:hypothetical protein
MDNRYEIVSRPGRGAIVLLLKTCDNCEGVEERVFTDSWTGKELCSMCLVGIINQVTMSPASEGDNLLELLDT